MCRLIERPIGSHPPLALKLRSGFILSNPHARWHFELLEQVGIPEEQWEEAVAESGFLDAEGTFIAGHGTRVLQGKHYFAQPSSEAAPSHHSKQKTVVMKAPADSWAPPNENPVGK
jgi:hypothetical protein